MTPEKAADGEYRLECQIPESRWVFPHLFEAKAFKDKRTGKTGDARYSVVMLMDPEIVKQIWPSILVVAQTRWPGRNFDEDVKYNRFKWPLLDGNKEAQKATANKKDGSFYQGKTILKASTKADFSVSVNKYDPSGQVVPIIDPKEIYGGCYGLTQVQFKSYTSGQSTDGVTAYLVAVCKTQDGERIAMGRTGADIFQSITPQPTNANPLPQGSIPGIPGT